MSIETITLANEQQKLEAIHKVSNLIQKVQSVAEKDALAHFVHEIVESESWNSNLAGKLLTFQIGANRELFVEV